MDIKRLTKNIPQFHTPTDVHPRDRGFTSPGIKHSVKIEYTTIDMSNMESDSKDSCKKSLTGMYDECAYSEVCQLRLKMYYIYGIISDIDFS